MAPFQPERHTRASVTCFVVPQAQPTTTGVLRRSPAEDWVFTPPPMICKYKQFTLSKKALYANFAQKLGWIWCQFRRFQDSIERSVTSPHLHCLPCLKTKEFQPHKLSTQTPTPHQTNPTTQQSLSLYVLLWSANFLCFCGTRACLNIACNSVCVKCFNVCQHSKMKQWCLARWRKQYYLRVHQFHQRKLITSLCYIA